MLSIRSFLYVCMLVALVADRPAAALFAQSDPAPVSATTIPQEKVIQIDALNQLLKAQSEKPVILQVGSHIMFVQAHIPGSLYAGPGSDTEGQHLLHTHVVDLPKNKLIVLYCGCCPWNRCPNVGPAYAHLMHMGFTNVKVLYIANNFGADWVGKGYAVEKGE
jgi:thiosulfate/3-mercaptopyruvate sulfurtransferase